MDGKQIYKSLSQPPKEALKTIGGGKLKNFTDINPQWRYEAMTEAFGLCGEGWYYNIVKIWERECSNGEVLVWMQIDLFIKEGEGWSKPIPGIGGNKVIALEKGEPTPNDEGYKMVETDALSDAMKKIGVGADIYAGRWDGSKYRVSTQDAIEDIKSQAQAMVKEFDRLFGEGYIEKSSFDNMHNAYDNCKTEDDYRELISRSSVNISEAKKKMDVRTLVQTESLF